jgi:translation initiation factor 1
MLAPGPDNTTRAAARAGARLICSVMARRSSENTRLVYSSEVGRVSDPQHAQASGPPTDGIVRVSRTSSGRKGKTVTLITGVPHADTGELVRELKRLCGSGGAVKDGVVEIQGDHRAKVVAHLDGRYRVKLAGG